MRNIKMLRVKTGLSQQALATLLGLHQTAVSQWEKGRTSPDLTSAKFLADYFNVSIDYIFDREAFLNLDGDDFLIALSTETSTLTDAQKQDVLDFVRFKKSQKQ